MAKKKEASVDDLFRIFHQYKNGKHFLTFSPAIGCEGYPPKEVEVTEEQFNELKYHFVHVFFGPGINEKFCYVK